ncbi:MAG: hypothetical protein JW716_03705 [Candidatus Aenigmarchaeota archaeon]|nr:hypothetical protein [Candidatus Aenigmarchaeota archaeon]
MQTKEDMKKLKGIGNVLYWDFYYSTGYGGIAGLSNGLSNMGKGKSFSDGFGEGYVNNFSLGMGVNLAYPVIFRQLQKTNHYRLYANLFTLGINAGFLGWHYLTGTDNPLQTTLATTAAGLLMANKHVSETINKD